MPLDFRHATHPDKVEEEVARSSASATAAETEEESLVSVLILVRFNLVQWRQLLRRIVVRHLVRKLHSHFVVLRFRADLVHSILRLRIHVLQEDILSLDDQDQSVKRDVLHKLVVECFLVFLFTRVI